MSSGKRPVQWTLLHCAAFFGHCEGLEALLDLRASIEEATTFGYTALHHASRNGHSHITEALLRRQAHMEAKTREGRTPLMNSAHQGYVESVEVLLRFQADIDAKSKYGTTALHSAADSGHVEVVELLMDARADPSSPCAVDRATPIHCAARDNHLEVVEAMMSKAPVERTRQALMWRDSRGLSVLDVAQRNKADDVAELVRASSDTSDGSFCKERFGFARRSSVNDLAS